MFHVPDVARVCAYQAAQKYSVPYGEMLGILHTEGGGRGVIDRDRNGTEDLGWAQINSVHLPWLHRYGITRAVLLTRPCVNIDTGAYILREAYLHTGNWFSAAEGYNAGVHDLPAGFGYARHVFSAWSRYSGAPAQVRLSYRKPPVPLRVRASSARETVPRHAFIILSPS